MEAVATLIEQGKVRAAGVCNYNVAQVEEALKTVTLASNQVPYSLINRAIEKDVVAQAIANGMSILPYSPLQRGLLTGKIKEDHVFNEGDTRTGNRFYTKENIRQANAMLSAIKPIADRHGATLVQTIINWTTRQPAMDCVLVGARDEVQVNQNVDALNFVLSDEDLRDIEEIAARFVLMQA
jgi:aryl-alcohol dehydrogenase-like predicted oxidoreductase